MKITEPILHVLGSASPDGNKLYLAPVALDSVLYRQVADVLETAGGVWSKTVQGFTFPEGTVAWDVVVDLTSREEVTTARERVVSTQFFPTPPDVVEELLNLAWLSVQHTVLEPSAGTGAIAAAAGAVCTVDCIEKDPEYATALQSISGVRNVAIADFLTVPPPSPAARYDRVIMNPPFAGGADVRHVQHALKFVKPGGRLVAVMSTGTRWHKDRATRAFRAVVETSHGQIIELPANAFEASGTSVPTVMVVIPVPETGRHETDEPVRVTTDLTARNLPMFDPMTSAPGVYIHDSLGGSNRVFRFAGYCILCARRTWCHDDGEDDVRGVFGVNTGTPLGRDKLRFAIENVPVSVSYPCCSGCLYGSGRETYEHAVQKAARLYQQGMSAAQIPEQDTDREGQLALFT